MQLGMTLLLGKGSDKGFTGKDTFASSWPPSTLRPPKGFAKNSPGGSSKGAAKGSEKTSFKEKVSLHPPFLHLLPILRPLDLLADHKFPQRPHSYLPNFLMVSLGILSGSPLRNFPPLALCSPHLSLIAHLYLFFYLESSIYVHSPSSPHFFILPLILLPCGQPGHIVRLAAWSFNPLYLPPFFFILLIPFSPPSSAPPPRLLLALSRCSPNMTLPNEAAPVVDRARRCGLSPCRAINWCRLWCAAVHERCSYVPPILPVRTMFIEAADQQLHYSMCLSIISNTSYLSRSSHSRY